MRGDLGELRRRPKLWARAGEEGLGRGAGMEASAPTAWIRPDRESLTRAPAISRRVRRDPGFNIGRRAGGREGGGESVGAGPVVCDCIEWCRQSSKSATDLGFPR